MINEIYHILDLPEEFEKGYYPIKLIDECDNGIYILFDNEDKTKKQKRIGFSGVCFSATYNYSSREMVYDRIHTQLGPDWTYRYGKLYFHKPIKVENSRLIKWLDDESGETLLFIQDKLHHFMFFFEDNLMFEVVAIHDEFVIEDV